MSAVVEARPAPSVELRTALALASLAAALIHVMSGLHDGALGVQLTAGGVLAAFAAVFGFTGTRTVLAPAAAFTVVLTAGLPNLLATPVQLAVAGGAVALLWGATDRTCTLWSRLAFAMFVLAAFSGFGHLAH
ncbi:MAG TPA: hypothetical protein VFZ00_34845 [Solirubrobacter sp.]|nr:hypothetical protein [Solirubrobacter sp.]